MHGIAHERERIAGLKQELRAAGVVVIDLPDDMG
jgi:hypothetical protein